MSMVEQLVNFITSGNAGVELEKQVHKKLAELNLPKSMNELEDESVLDEQLENNLCFHFSNGEDSSDVVICGYMEKKHTLIVRAFGGMDSLYTISLAELDIYNLLEIAVMLSFYSGGSYVTK